jgi:hypothetical protein
LKILSYSRSKISLFTGRCQTPFILISLHFTPFVVVCQQQNALFYKFIYTYLYPWVIVLFHVQQGVVILLFGLFWEKRRGRLDKVRLLWYNWATNGKHNRQQLNKGE